MYELDKISSSGPEGTQRFDTLEELRDELKKWVCNACFGEKVTILHPLTKTPIAAIPDDIKEPPINRQEYDNSSVEEQIQQLLRSPCGYEFMGCLNTIKAIGKKSNG